MPALSMALLIIEQVLLRTIYFKMSIFPKFFYMTKYPLFIKVFLFFFLSTSIFGQGNKIPCIRMDASAYPQVKSHFETFQIIKINSSLWSSHLSLMEGLGRYSLLFPQGEIKMALEKSHLRRPGMPARSEQGSLSLPAEATYTGYLDQDGGGIVKISIAPDFIYGWYEVSGQNYFIEPLRSYLEADENMEDLYIIYQAGDVIDTGEHRCGVWEMMNFTGRILQSQGGAGLRNDCKEIELATACDVSYKNNWGGSAGAILQMEAVVNAMNPLWVGAFDHDYQFTIAEAFVPDIDPWTSSTDMCLLIEEFRLWGEGGGFITDPDLAQLWTMRDMGIPLGSPNCPSSIPSGYGYVGFSYTPMICTEYAYLLLEQFAPTLSLLKILNAHEIGHTMGALTHTSDGIMTSSLSINTIESWEFISITEINDHMLNGNPGFNIPPPGCLDTACPEIPCMADAGTLTATGDLQIDTNGSVSFTVSGEEAIQYDFVISDHYSSQVVYFGSSSTISGGVFGEGVYCVQGVSHDGSLFFNLGDPAPAPGGSSGDCFSISPCTSGTTVEIMVLPTRVKLNLLLEGFHNGNGVMESSFLSPQEILPHSQPYTGAPHYYTGTEYAIVFPAGTIDWVYIEARNAFDENIIEDAAVGFINSDGDLISLDGTEGIIFNNITTGNYHVAIFHRNHLAVMTALPLSLPNSMSYSFTSTANSAKGIEKLKLQNGFYVLYAGDFNGDGNINSSDYNTWAQNSALVGQYVGMDANGNAVVNATDYNLWYANRSKLAYSALIY